MPKITNRMLEQRRQQRRQDREDSFNELKSLYYLSTRKNYEGDDTKGLTDWYSRKRLEAAKSGKPIIDKDKNDLTPYFTEGTFSDLYDTNMNDVKTNIHSGSDVLGDIAAVVTGLKTKPPLQPLKTGGAFGLVDMPVQLYKESLKANPDYEGAAKESASETGFYAAADALFRSGVKIGSGVLSALYPPATGGGVDSDGVPLDMVNPNRENTYQPDFSKFQKEKDK